jgi:hypothetical protein
MVSCFSAEEEVSVREMEQIIELLDDIKLRQP